MNQNLNPLDEGVEQVRTLPNDTAGAGLFLLTPVKDHTVVHLPFLLQRTLLHLHLTHALLLDLKRL